MSLSLMRGEQYGQLNKYPITKNICWCGKAFQEHGLGITEYKGICPLIKDSCSIPNGITDSSWLAVPTEWQWGCACNALGNSASKISYIYINVWGLSSTSRPIPSRTSRSCWDSWKPHKSYDSWGLDYKWPTACPAELRTVHKNGNKLDFTSPVQLLGAWWAQDPAGFITLRSKILQTQNLPPLKVVLSQSI